MKAPRVVVLDHVSDPKRQALGRYDPKTDTLMFSRKEYYNYDKDSRRYAVFHELGHWFREHFVDLTELQNFVILGNEFPEEGFADAFAAWILVKEELRQKHPRHCRLLDRWIRNGKGKGRISEREIRRLGRNIYEELARAECGGFGCP